MVKTRDEKLNEIINEISSKGKMVDVTEDTTVLMIYQATLGRSNMGFYLTPNDAEKSVLDFKPDAKKTKDFNSNLDPPTGEYSIVSRALYCKPFIDKTRKRNP
jgi:hypothetical protein